MIAMLVGCGLRRGELLGLRIDSIQSREDIGLSPASGQAGHIRTIPIPIVGEGSDRRMEGSRLHHRRLALSIDQQNGSGRNQ
jgi:integrase